MSSVTGAGRTSTRSRTHGVFEDNETTARAAPTALREELDVAAGVAVWTEALDAYESTHVRTSCLGRGASALSPPDGEAPWTGAE